MNDNKKSVLKILPVKKDPENESKLQISKTNSPICTPGTFSFAYSDGVSRAVHPSFITLSPHMNGYCCIFPSDLAHQVHPFYTSDEDRISISGNISYRHTD